MRKSREELIKEIKDKLAPKWLLDDGVVMYDPKHNSLVISPTNALRHGITNVEVAQNRLGSRTILRFRLDFNQQDKKYEIYREYLKGDEDEG